MPRIGVSESGDSFVCDGKPFFYLGDTVWMAFARASLEEWKQYLFYRKRQGFNVLQFAPLPAYHDCTKTAEDRYFCRVRPDGSFDFMNLNESYFDRAEQMVKMAVEEGFVPELSLIWVNYIAGTWAAKLAPECVMNREEMLHVARYVVERFKKYQPIYFACGDVDLTAAIDFSAIGAVMHLVKELDPDGLVGLHITGENSYLPPEFLNSPDLDFYTFQSGHGPESDKRACALARDFIKYPKRPVINAEPCYEGHMMTGDCFFRKHSAFDVRRTAWVGMLSGAKAGIGYGAHGLWSWHRYDDVFKNEHLSGSCFNWDTALRFEGAWDCAFIRYLFETYGLLQLQPVETTFIRPSHPDLIRVARMPNDTIVIYLPYAVNLELSMDLSGYDFVGFDLANRHVTRPVVEAGKGHSCIKVPQANTDMLYIGKRRG